VESNNGSGDLPYQASVTITRSGSTASVSHTAHGLANSAKVVIRGADQPEYNGIQTISNVTANAYDYTVSGTPTTPATGTIVCSGVVVEGTTNASGEVSASRTFSVDQAILGRIRKQTSSPFYKAVRFTDTVDNVNGLTKTVQLQRDDG